MVDVINLVKLLIIHDSMFSFTKSQTLEILWNTILVSMDIEYT